MPDNLQSTQDSANIDRTATGAIADKGTTTEKVTTGQTSTTQEVTDKGTTATQTTDEEKSLANQTEDKSLLNQASKVAEGAPETYEPFKVPEGYKLDEEIAKEVGGLFKGMGLSQAQAQSLVDFHVKQTNEAYNQPYEAWRETQKQWVREVKADPFLGPRLGQVTSTISKGLALAAGNNTQLLENFKQMMDYTGAGNNPAFIRLFYEMASMLTEGGHVAGKGPSPAGQQKTGEMPSAAKAMYPNLA